MSINKYLNKKHKCVFSLSLSYTQTHIPDKTGDRLYVLIVNMSHEKTKLP